MQAKVFEKKVTTSCSILSLDWNHSTNFRPLRYFDLSPNRIIHFILSKRILSISDRKMFMNNIKNEWLLLVYICHIYIGALSGMRYSVIFVLVCLFNWSHFLKNKKSKRLSSFAFYHRISNVISRHIIKVSGTHLIYNLTCWLVW